MLLCISAILIVSAENHPDETTTTDENLNEKNDYYLKPKSQYTSEFYIALGVGSIAFLIILYLIYVMVRGPKKQFKN